MTLRGGVIGTGFFAGNHLNAWKMVNGAEIVAICDLDKTRLTSTGGAFGIDALYTDMATMLAEQRLDFVDVITTAPSHRSLVELALAQDVHVICQKPFAENITDARAMVQAAEAAGKTLMVHENFRWQSAIRAVIDALRAGRIGTPFFCRASFRSGYDVFSGQPYLAEGDRFIIEDLGIHILDVARALMGDVTRLAATTTRINPKIKGEDVATMLLTHESGMTSVVDCSYATRRRPETFPETLLEIDGDRGTLRLDAGYKLTLQIGAEEEVQDVAPPLLDWAERPWHNIQESVAIIQQHFVDCLASGAEPETSGADNLKTFTLVEAAYLSAAKGRVVDVAEFSDPA
ncbi:Gfo/Idh/MocA family oxidoreductase [Phaeobacter sp. J2-8]|uniref:Gfo/Idh/MocA family protein n=1 Tax=Phaeobacter sp. J2-8 TaxID=2931394 RepID=UPI001FD53CAD|nr:Gfo/Idh/MocA family oxidoreductase [Phaeobacter sp. J2-8]MCJ7873660.1 Gfo/Idh/MocA family oxidoreductase [Phaeobacter sp. J2-8]